jgi:pyroglutamyl-peptidase
MRRALSLTLLLALGCEASPPPPSPNAGLLRDLANRDGKRDSAGTPLNARTTEAEILCDRRGRREAWTFVVEPTDGAGEICRGALDGGAQRGRMVADVRLRAEPADRDRPIATFRAYAGGQVIATAVLRPRSVRGDDWMSFPLVFNNTGAARIDIAVEYHGNGLLELDDFEVFPQKLDLVISPGSGEFAGGDWLTFELGLDEPELHLRANGSDVTPRLRQLLDEASAFEESTEYRHLIYVPVDELLAGSSGTVELEARAGTSAARIQVRREPPPCAFEGAGGKKILVTAFQPFPADAWHENISSVALAAMPAVAGARVMRLVLPVEFDRAAAEVADAIARCAPDAVLSLGQGGDELALEEVAYNQKDTSEVPGGVPDNRGVIAIDVPIVDAGPAERPTRLPLARLAAALDAIGQPHQQSRDPGRYICNNVFYEALGAVEGSDAIAGFVHLPYRTSFSGADRQRWGRVVAALVGALAR